MEETNETGSTEVGSSLEEFEGETGMKSDLWSFLKVVFISFLIVLPIRAFVVQPFIVRGPSMDPTYHENEYLIVNEIGYTFSEPRQFEVIVFRFPKKPSQFFIKRIIGIPGQEVIIRQGKVFVDGKEIAESYLPEGTLTAQDTIMKLDEEEYFVLGDNRAQSSDSRLWGVLPRNHIVGKVWIRVFPFDRAGILQ